MKHLSLTLSFVVLLMVLTACGNLSALNEYNEYSSQISEYANTEKEIIDEYRSVTGDNYTDDITLYNKLKDSIIPKTRDFVSNLEDVSAPNTELNAIHKIIIEVWNQQYGAFTTMLTAIDNQDSAQITNANDRLDKAQAKISEYTQALEEYRDKYKIILKDS